MTILTKTQYHFIIVMIGLGLVLIGCAPCAQPTPPATSTPVPAPTAMSPSPTPVSAQTGQQKVITVWTHNIPGSVEGDVPARRSALAQSKLYGESGPLRLFVQQLESDRAVPRPITPAYATITTAFAEAVGNIINGADVKTELSRAAQKIDQDIHYPTRGEKPGFLSFEPSKIAAFLAFWGVTASWQAKNLVSSSQCRVMKSGYQGSPGLSD